MTIGKRIKEERLAKKWTQEQLAVKLNVSRSTVSSWEVERNYPDLETIIAISDLFGQSLDQLLREDPEMITKKDRKVKNEKVYFRLLGLIGICFLIFIGNYVLKIAENSHYQENLKVAGWTKIQDAYILEEDDRYYWATLPPVRSTSFFQSNDSIALLAATNPEDYSECTLQLEFDQSLGLSFTTTDEIDLPHSFFVTIDEKGQLTGDHSIWSSEDLTLINDYLTDNQHAVQELIDDIFTKKQQIQASADSKIKRDK